MPYPGRATGPDVPTGEGRWALIMPAAARQGGVRGSASDGRAGRAEPAGWPAGRYRARPVAPTRRGDLAGVPRGDRGAGVRAPVSAGVAVAAGPSTAARRREQRDSWSYGAPTSPPQCCARPPPASRRGEAARLLALNVGVIGVLIAGVRPAYWLAIPAAALVFTAVAAHLTALAVRLRRALPAPYAITVRYYLAASGRAVAVPVRCPPPELPSLSAASQRKPVRVRCCPATVTSRSPIGGEARSPAE